MTGLEKILKEIEAQAKANADVILAEAKKEAEEIMNAAKSEAQEKCAQITSKSETDVKAVFSRAESAAVLAKKQMILSAKQQLINDILANARKSISALPDDKYCDIILRMIKKFAHNKAGVIVFSADDKKRLPADFSQKIGDALKDKPLASLEISGDSAQLDGGFLLIYGDIEENCSFNALFDDAREELQDKLNAFLFSSEAI